MNIRSFSEYKLGNTPLYQAKLYCPSGNLYLKLESSNPNGSIKDRTAYYIIKDLLEMGKLKRGISLIESSSGNLGLALGYFARELGIRFRCLVDPMMPQKKLEQLKLEETEVQVVSLGKSPDYKTARISIAKNLNQQSDWIWTNQYDNPSNSKAHYETTGPEIWTQTKGQINYFVCSVGTGGTICGVGHYLKQQNTNIKIVAVEPEGSTIFGGKPSQYLNVGAGMREPSGIFKRSGHIVDYYCKVNDGDALQECVNFLNLEGLSVGVTTGLVLVTASYLAMQHPDENVVALSPDGGEKYVELFEDISPLPNKLKKVFLNKLM